MSNLWRVDPALETALMDAGISSPSRLIALGHRLSDHEDGTATRWTSRRGPLTLTIQGEPRAFFLKTYRYPTWKKSKGLLGRGTVYGRAPELVEFDNLLWLRDRGIPAVRPVAAAATRTRGMLTGQALLTEIVPRARDLAAWITDPARPLQRDAVLQRRCLAQVASVVAAMHLQGFAHRDLFARNILVGLRGSRPQVWLLDCRRGGVASRKHRLRDLAQLRRDLLLVQEPALTPTLWTHFLTAYRGNNMGVGPLDAEIRTA